PEYPLIQLAYRLIPWVYPLADQVVAVSRGVADDLERTRRLVGRVEVIYNPIVGHDLPHLAAAQCDHPWLVSGVVPVLVAVGRLSAEKDFASLIRATKIVQEQRPVRLIIVGEGSRRPELERLRHELELDQVVDLPGWI